MLFIHAITNTKESPLKYRLIGKSFPILKTSKERRASITIFMTDGKTIKNLTYFGLSNKHWLWQINFQIPLAG